jgi:hypothetical protein
MKKDEINILDLQRKFGIGYATACKLKEWVLSREADILNGLENALSQTESCSACRGCGFYAHQISDNECERRVCELCSGSGRMQVPNVDEALSIIQRRKDSHE